jgi:hypothetical protein
MDVTLFLAYVVLALLGLVIALWGKVANLHNEVVRMSDRMAATDFAIAAAARNAVQATDTMACALLDQQ